MVQVFDDFGEQVYPDVISGPTSVNVIFANPMSGSVVLI
jgi:hypothetical protein